jgi:hypothetical protein
VTEPAPAICLGFRNWHLDHLDRCLETLTSSHRWPIVVVDYGCHPEIRAKVQAILAQPHLDDVTLVVQMTAAEWSRSRALNLAAAHVPPETRTLVFTDADMLFPMEWFEACLAMLDTPSGREGLWLTDSRDLPRLNGPQPQPGGWWNSAAWLLGMSQEHSRVGQGAAMVVPRDWFNRVGGFDEYYHVWGCEDNDLVLRAKWDQVAVDWLPGAWVAHQWHPRDWPTTTQYQQVQRNRDYLAHRIADHGPIVRNRLTLAQKEETA